MREKEDEEKIIKYSGIMCSDRSWQYCDTRRTGMEKKYRYKDRRTEKRE